MHSGSDCVLNCRSLQVYSGFHSLENNMVGLARFTDVVANIVFLYPPHRGYISFVNTFVTHRNNDLGPYVP